MTLDDLPRADEVSIAEARALVDKGEFVRGDVWLKAKQAERVPPAEVSNWILAHEVAAACPPVGLTPHGDYKWEMDTRNRRNRRNGHQNLESVDRSSKPRI